LPIHGTFIHTRNAKYTIQELTHIPMRGTHTDAACVGPEPKMIYDPTKKLI